MVFAGAFAALYILAAAIGSIVSGNVEFIFYIVVMLVLMSAVLLVHWRLGLSPALLWLLAIWGGLHMAGGLVPVPDSWPINGSIRVLYSWWIIPDADGIGGYLKFDHVVHAFGFGVTTWLCWQILCGVLKDRVRAEMRPTLGLIILCIAASTGFGALNEIIEFTATLFTETNVGGYVNTGYDLISNLTGAMVAGTLIGLFHRKA